MSADSNPVTSIFAKKIEEYQDGRVPAIVIERAEKGGKCQRLLGFERTDGTKATCGHDAYFDLLIRWRGMRAKEPAQRTPICGSCLRGTIDALLDVPAELIAEDFEVERMHHAAWRSETCTEIIDRRSGVDAHVCGRPTTHRCRFCGAPGNMARKRTRSTFRSYMTIRKGRIVAAREGDPIIVRGAICAMHAKTCARRHPRFLEEIGVAGGGAKQ